MSGCRCIDCKHFSYCERTAACYEGETNEMNCSECKTPEQDCRSGLE